MRHAFLTPKHAKLGKGLDQEDLSVGLAPSLPDVGQMSLEWYDECGGRWVVPISTRRQTTILAIPYLRDHRRHGETRPGHMAVRTPESRWGPRHEITPLIVAPRACTDPAAMDAAATSHDRIPSH